MKQVGTPIATVQDGIKLMLEFGSITACLSYLVYYYPKSSDLLNISNIYGILLTGQVTYNTIILGSTYENDNVDDMS